MTSAICVQFTLILGSFSKVTASVSDAGRVDLAAQVVQTRFPLAESCEISQMLGFIKRVPGNPGDS